ncbi:KxYKxGKxW signal peptide domain-containing protein [Limosilactobacillus reuteri]|nr:KxYKxGKxW signal peptide domain-containing protein [Limosilactobacillus reuteri]
MLKKHFKLYKSGKQ